MLLSIWRSWIAWGRRLGDQFARVVLTVFYFTIALPFALIVRSTQDPLGLRSPQRGWAARHDAEPNLEDARRMF